MIFLLLEPIHQCRNRGGTDVTVCSTNSGNKFTSPGNAAGTLLGVYKDIECGQHRPLVRYCHIPGLNDPSDSVYYEFSPYASFDAASANSVCHEFGAGLPHLETELDHYYLVELMENLLNRISQGQTYSQRWMSWPVSNAYTILSALLKL